jgi:ankyrin repeat protein
LAALFVCGAAHTALAADPARCRDLNLRYETGKSQLTAVEVSLTLFAAADRNCVDLATQLLDQGASVNAQDRLGARPLSHAARAGHLEMVDLLLQRGAPINARNLAGSTALYVAAERGQLGVVQRLIDRGADLDLKGRSGTSPVAAAAFAGRAALVKLLLAHGADGRTPDDTGKPPIIYAAASGQLDIVKQLLALNIDINARYANDLTLLMWASGPDEKVGEAQALEVVSYLLDAGARIDERRRRQPVRDRQVAAGTRRRSDPSRQSRQARRRPYRAVLAARNADAALRTGLQWGTRIRRIIFRVGPVFPPRGKIVRVGFSIHADGLSRIVLTKFLENILTHWLCSDCITGPPACD